jgi:hypothetical protein
MTDDVINNGNSDTGNVVPGEALTPTQNEALNQGWVPKDEFEGDAEKWVDAGEFLRRGELFRKIETQSKEMKEMRKALGELAKHNSKIREVEYERALQTLKAEKKAALNEGDADKVVDIDDRIDLVKAQQRQEAATAVQQVSQEIHPELKNWINRNGWYETTASMRGWADARGVELAQEGKSPSEVLVALEKEVKTRFSEKFHNPNRDRASAVEPGRTRANVKADAEFELTDVEKQVMNTLVRQGVMTKEKYIADLKAIKEKN